MSDLDGVSTAALEQEIKDRQKAAAAREEDQWARDFRVNSIRAEARKRVSATVRLSPAVQAEMDERVAPEDRPAVAAALQVLLPLLEIEAAHENHDGAFESTCTICYREHRDNNSYSHWEPVV